MPIFDFKCENCAHVWEALLPDAKTYPASCPGCGSMNLSGFFLCLI
jgi:putative FmdB family regulatory protein